MKFIRKYKILLFIVLFVSVLSLFLFSYLYSLRSKNLPVGQVDRSVNSSDSGDPVSPFGDHISEDSEKIEFNTAVKDYLKIIGVDPDAPEPGEGYVYNDTHVEDVTRYKDLGYVKARVVSWEHPDLIKLDLAEGQAKDIREYSIECGKNTALISKASTTKTGFYFLSELENSAVVYIKCLDSDCTSLGGSCILLK